MKFRNVLAKYCKSYFRPLTASLATSAIMMMSVVTSFAADNTDVQTAFNSGLADVQSQLTGYLVACIPVVLSIFALFVGIKKAMGWVKSLLGKAS